MDTIIIASCYSLADTTRTWSSCSESNPNQPPTAVVSISDDDNETEHMEAERRCLQNSRPHLTKKIDAPKASNQFRGSRNLANLPCATQHSVIMTPPADCRRNSIDWQPSLPPRTLLFNSYFGPKSDREECRSKKMPTTHTCNPAEFAIRNEQPVCGRTTTATADAAVAGVSNGGEAVVNSNHVKHFITPTAEAGENVAPPWRPTRLRKLFRISRCRTSGLNSGPVDHTTPASAGKDQRKVRHCPRRIEAGSDYGKGSPLHESSARRSLSSTKNLRIFEAFAQSSGRSRKFRCKHCRKGFIARSSLHFHNYSHYGTKNCLGCKSNCLAMFLNEPRLAEHQNERSERSQTGARLAELTYRHYVDSERPYGCRLCSRSYLYESHLRIHHRLMHAEDRATSHLCEYCGERFRFELHYKKHMRFRCGACSRRTCNFGALKLHHKYCGSGLSEPRRLRKKDSAALKSKGKPSKKKQTMILTSKSNRTAPDTSAAKRRSKMVTLAVRSNSIRCQPSLKRRKTAVEREQEAFDVVDKRLSGVVGNTAPSSVAPRNLFRAYSEWRAKLEDKST